MGSLYGFLTYKCVWCASMLSMMMQKSAGHISLVKILA
jgi:hypothetical protein